MNSRWVSECDAHDRAVIVENYQRAYMTGQKHSPKKIVIQNESNHVPPPGQARCTSSLQCKTREFRKLTGRGFNVSMGNGDEGDYCNSMIDCRSTLFCRADDAGVSTCQR